MLLNLSLVLLLSTCLVVAQETITQSNRPDYCSLPPMMAGEKKCKSYIPKWTFNETQATCVSYVYGGCNGTKNLFDTEGECQATCRSPVVPQRKQADASAPPTSASGPSVHPHQYLLAVINCLYSFFFLLTRYF
ncbi:kunitz-type serine protease inhibitor textilinin-3-like [Daphnia pulicaria]|uniref:kunitz-type serine protease inhibitor textilinin-3-like n=1 Tax=Daphnia pulicaria TaxID=35523 RepID=UPI001EE9C987|nr:kunitz-type serine protease inhibitor textilinin-3-like [Daphnia pulicaria]